MGTRGAFWACILGTVASAVVFLALTADFHRHVGALTHADRLDGRAVAGKRVFERRNCNDCHTILGFGGYYAPDLTRAVRRVGADGIRYRLKDPGVALAASWRKMPRQRLADSEIDEIVAFLDWVGGVENNDWPPQDSVARKVSATGPVAAPAGEDVLRGQPCLGCHSLHGRGGTFGPPFDMIGRMLTVEQIEHYVRNPKAVNPQAMMPAQSAAAVADADLERIAAFLAGLK
ncbi:MAG TPA: c-type cytochrome [bacterium]